ncbi:MAG TPA: RNA-binding S4 domain-containing protein [Stellaceae bacterium]|nr:RNA-binding S4 domain-containing protein [Stellaceae bacterium]
MSDAGDSIRIDKWLWHARMARTRGLAARLCEAGQVSVGEASVVKPHHKVRIGDRVMLADRRARRNLVVLGLGARRGPAAEARLLYHEPEPPVSLRQAEPWTPLLDEENWA